MSHGLFLLTSLLKNAIMQFITTLMNQQVAHEIVTLKLLTVFLANNIEVVVGFVKECSSLLHDFSPMETFFYDEKTYENLKINTLE